MKLLNINEDVPEYFYVFIGNGNRMQHKINYHNYKLNKMLISGGFEGLITEPKLMQDFIEGNINYAPYVPAETTFNIPTSHMMNVVNSYNVEYILDCHRPKKYPSRFSATYAFGDFESCEKASRLYPNMFKLENVRKFKIKKIGNELDDCVKVVKCNMEIVTRMWNCDIQFFDPNSIMNVANAYWNGFGQVATEIDDIETGEKVQKVSDVLYEYLIEGILEEVQEDN